MVRSSGVSMLAMAWPVSSHLESFGSARRSKENFTSAEVSGVPLWNLHAGTQDKFPGQSVRVFVFLGQARNKLSFLAFAGKEAIEHIDQTEQVESELSAAGSMVVGGVSSARTTVEAARAGLADSRQASNSPLSNAKGRFDIENSPFIGTGNRRQDVREWTSINSVRLWWQCPSTPRAARMKMAAGRRIGGGGHFAAEHDPVPG